MYLLIHDEKFVTLRAEAAPFAAEPGALDDNGLPDAGLEPSALPSFGEETAPCGQEEKIKMQHVNGQFVILLQSIAPNVKHTKAYAIM